MSGVILSMIFLFLMKCHLAPCKGVRSGDLHCNSSFENFAATHEERRPGFIFPTSHEGKNHRGRNHYCEDEVTGGMIGGTEERQHHIPALVAGKLCHRR
jgi:hypothetical protein